MPPLKHDHCNEIYLTVLMDPPTISPCLIDLMSLATDGDRTGICGVTGFLMA